MYKIYIDSTKRYEKLVRLINFDLGEKAIVAEKSGDIDAAYSIKILLEENNLNMSDIDEFIVNKGPGSFTGLKMGVTLANVLNWALDKKQINELVLPDYGGEPNIQQP